MIIYIKSSGTAIFREGDVLSFNVGRVDGDVSIGTVIKGYSWILISKTIEAIKRTIAWKQRVLRGIFQILYERSILRLQILMVE